MRHLNDEQLLDVVEDRLGIGRFAPSSERPAGADPRVSEQERLHLESCERCRQQAAALQQAIALVQETEVPEPSPLFWDHLSSRIHAAVALEASAGQVRRRWWRWSERPVALEFGLAAVVALMVFFGVWQRQTPATPPSDGQTAQAEREISVPAVEPPVGSLLADDPSLSLLVELAGELDWEQAAEAGMTVASGTADAVVADLNADERLELRRLLNEALEGTL